MDKADYYSHYQTNLEMLNREIRQVKKLTQESIGKKAWQEKKGYDSRQIAATEKDINACTRLYSFLICSWFEARLMKILYENSSAAFSDAEINTIRQEKTMENKWKYAFSMAVCKSYGFSYQNNTDYSPYFPSGSLAQKNYSAIYGLFSDLSDAITIRNRFAHGQWDVQFNSSNNAVAIYPFLTTYDNIQKLDILNQCFDHIGDLISAYVTQKDKTNPSFDQNVEKKIRMIFEKKTRIANSDFQKYAAKLGRLHEAQRNRYLPANSDDTST